MVFGAHAHASLPQHLLDNTYALSTPFLILSEINYPTRYYLGILAVSVEGLWQARPLAPPGPLARRSLLPATAPYAIRSPHSTY
jgi:hypothetical protein